MQECITVSIYDFNKADWNNLNRFIALKSRDAHFYSTVVEIALERSKDLLFNAMSIYITNKLIFLYLKLAAVNVIP